MIDKFLLRLAAARGFFAKLWVLAKPYWFAKDRAEINLLGLRFGIREGWLGRATLVLILVLNILSVYMSKLLNDWNRRFFDALQQKDAAAFRHEIVYWLVLVALLIFVFVYSQWFQQFLTIRWRRWLTEVYYRDWLSNLTYYRMELTGSGTDNPEQRIEQDCAYFTSQTLDISIDLLSQIMTLVTFVVVLWGLSGAVTVPLFGGIAIPGYMVWVAVLYAIVGTWLTYKIGRPLIGVNFNLQRFNADFRYRMMRVRENSEAIALYHGEPDEERGLGAAFQRVYATWWRYMKYNKRLNWLTSFYGQVASIFPIIVAAPRYFAGVIPLGALTQTADAFGQVQGALSWFVGAYPTLADWIAVVDRLTSFGEAMERAKAAAERADGIRVEPTPAAALSVDGVDLRLPDGGLLIDKTSFAVRPGETVSVAGPSGSGKTTLFRALAGLWPYGTGRIAIPQDWRALFLPQRPYLPIGTLRDALCYPKGAAAFDDETCREVLESCLLGHLSGRLDESANWSMALSIGEQQRLAFARALLLRPEWIFIDEGTSALDAAMEAHVYALLKARLPGAAIVSVAHRAEVVALHDRHLSVDAEHRRLIEGRAETGLEAASA
jgi:putative ATP-binding cassette transporter